MPNFISKLRDATLTPYTASQNALTVNGFERLNTGIVDQDGTGDPIRNAMHKLLTNMDKALSLEDISTTATALKTAQRDLNADLWANTFHGNLSGTATAFSGTLQGDVTGTMLNTRIKNTTAAGTFTKLTVNDRGLVTAATTPSDIRQLGITNAVTTAFTIVTANPLTGGGALSGGTLTLGIDPGFLTGVTIPATTVLNPGDGVLLAPQNSQGGFRLIDNLSVSVRLTDSSHGMLGGYVGGQTNQPQHALATATTPGFISADDKRKLDQLAGDSGYVRGMIIMWNRPLSQIPSGWCLANGQSGSPNLVERYPRGASSDAQLNTYVGSATHAHAVDTPGHVLTTAQLPAFQLSGATHPEGNHYHTGSTAVNGSHDHNFRLELFTQKESGGPGGGPRCIEMARSPREKSLFEEVNTTNAAGGHAHNFTTSWAGTHAHTLLTNWIGSNHAHTHPRVTSLEANNTPESTYLYFIMKL